MVDIIVIGAGAAGLSAARDLSASGKSVCIVEARDRIGGRIHTLHSDGFSFPVEAGAEFMHGDLPFTTALMKEAQVSFQAGSGQSWSVKDSKISKDDLFNKDWDILMKRLNELDRDMTIDVFLRHYFDGPESKKLVEDVERFVQGYDAADIKKASALALREEWNSEDIQGYRPVGGYGQLMDFLLSQFQKHKGGVKLSTEVKKIAWKKGHVQLVTTKGETLEARQVVITIPVPVLKTDAVEFLPPIVEHKNALNKLEAGGVVKFLVEFKHRIWEQNEGTIRWMPGLNFVFSDAFVPTWWTQSPADVPLLTGWLAGPELGGLLRQEELLKKCIQSLAYIFGCTEAQMETEITAAKVVDWSADRLSRGAYTYTTLETRSAVNIISKPVANTLFFAGEAFYDGPEMGTVEAALASGKRAAEQISRKRD